MYAPCKIKCHDLLNIVLMVCTTVVCVSCTNKEESIPETENNEEYHFVGTNVFADILPQNIEQLSIEIGGIEYSGTLTYEDKDKINEFIETLSTTKIDFGECRVHNVGGRGFKLIMLDENQKSYQYSIHNGNIKLYIKGEKPDQLYSYDIYQDGLTEYLFNWFCDYFFHVPKIHLLLPPQDLSREDVVIEVEYLDWHTSYSYIMDNGFDIHKYGFTAYEEGVELDELPSSPGVHTIILENEKGSFVLKYYGDEA